MDEFDETSGESSFFDVTDSIGSGLSSVADGVVDAAKSSASYSVHSAELAIDAAQMEGHHVAAGWSAFSGDSEEAVYQNYAARVEFNEMREDVAEMAHEDLGL